jgi:outer membrane receptor for ferrienterochelin and colicins
MPHAPSRPRGLVRSGALMLAALTLCPTTARGQDAILSGTVTDSTSGQFLDGVRIELRRGGTLAASTISDATGRFSLSVAPGTYDVTVKRLDYRPEGIRAIALSAGERRSLAIRLTPQAIVFNPVVVSASRAEEKVLDAPAAVAVMDRQTIEERPALTPIDYLYATPAVQIATTGLTQHEVVLRGFNNAASGALLVLTDNRYAHVPSLRINAYNFIPLTDEDVERIEVVRGPGSALYGPNASNGVLHIITRSPFDSPGTAVSLGGGGRSLVHAQLRHASRLGRRFAVKISGQYLRGEDWPYTDPRDLGGDSIVERASGELRLDWRPSDGTTVTATAGLNQAIRNVDLTPLGAAQVDDWRSSYVQARVRSGRFFGQVFYNASNSGDTYIIRTGQGIVDKSQMMVAQLQHGVLVGSAVNLTYGLDLQRTNPRTEGTVTGRNEDDDAINEAGAYVQAEADLTPAVRLVLAARGDYHSHLEDPVFSPRAALVVQPTRDHSVRLTFNRAFSTPTTYALFFDLYADVMAPTPIQVWAEGVPTTGYHFKRDCAGGLCMRSPFTPPPLGGDTAWLPLDVTPLWPTVVQLAAQYDFDISGIPAPTAADIGTVLGRLDISTGSFEPVTDAQDIPPLTSTIETVIELGYQAVIAERFSLGINLYRGWKDDWVGAERAETPNAFFDFGTLYAYLADYMPADSAAILATAIASLPAATVVPIEARDPYHVIVTYRNYGRIGYWGADLEAGAVIASGLAVRANYQWVDKNTFEATDAAGTVETIPLNAPANRLAFSVLYRGERTGVHAEVRGRWVDSFPVRSGEYAGTVDAYTVLDALVGYRLPFARNVTLTLSALNLLDTDHVEFVGTPSIRRLITGSVRAEF